MATSLDFGTLWLKLKYLLNIEGNLLLNPEIKSIVDCEYSWWGLFASTYCLSWTCFFILYRFVEKWRIELQRVHKEHIFKRRNLSVPWLNFEIDLLLIIDLNSRLLLIGTTTFSDPFIFISTWSIIWTECPLLDIELLQWFPQRSILCTYHQFPHCDLPKAHKVVRLHCKIPNSPHKIKHQEYYLN